MSFSARRFLPLLFLLIAPAASAAQEGKTAPFPVGPDGRAQYTVAVLPGVDAAGLGELVDLGMVVERDSGGRVIAYLSDEGLAKLDALGIAWKAIPDPGLEALEREQAGEEGVAAASYHDYDALTSALQQVVADHPSITRLASAGTSIDGHELWWLKITGNPDVEEDEPAFKYTATIHGDEPVGTENCLRLIDLLTDGYGTDPRMTRLVDEVEIWIMPMMNPDGNTRHQRSNAEGYDLNRSFPDPYEDPVNTPDGRPRETQLVMNWQAANATVLSANFHGGALVVNYPFDNNETGSSVYTAAPDDDILQELALEYSEDNLPMYNGSFTDGITNGAAWYAITGGMQDWNYVYHGNIDFTIELDNTKWPPASELDRFWDENRESMVSYLERVLTGVRGVVTDQETGDPVSATLTFAGRDLTFHTDPEVGDFHRPVPAGTFDLVVDAVGYISRTVPFTVVDSEADAVRVDVTLEPRPTDLDYDGHRIAEDSGGNGYLDAGENGKLAVSVRNGGRFATGLGGSLLPLTPHAETSGTATWPDLGPGEGAESAEPHLGVHVDPAIPAGHKLAFAVEWESAEGDGGLTEAFFVPVSAPGRQLGEPSDLPLNIEDYQTIESTVDVAFDEQIDEVNVRVDITHTYIGDIRVTLIDPEGAEFRLHDRTGGSADDIHTWYGTETEPADSLDPLAGRSSLGTWILRVYDAAGGDQGTLDDWTLEMYTRPFEDPLAEVLLRDVSRTESGNVLIEWWPGGSADSYSVYRSADPSSESAFVDVTTHDPDVTDTIFEDSASGDLLYWIVTATGHTGEGLWGHFGR